MSEKSLTVAELIAMLQTMPPHLKVMISDGGWDEDKLVDLDADSVRLGAARVEISLS